MRNGTIAAARRLFVMALLGWAVSVAHSCEAVWDALREPGKRRRAAAQLCARHVRFAHRPARRLLASATSTRAGGHKPRASVKRSAATSVTVGDVLVQPAMRCMDTARLAFGRAQAWLVLQGSLNDAELRRRQVAEMKSAIAAHRGGPPLVLVTHGSVVTEPDRVNIRMGEFVVLRRGADGTHAVAATCTSSELSYSARRRTRAAIRGAQRAPGATRARGERCSCPRPSRALVVRDPPAQSFTAEAAVVVMMSLGPAGCTRGPCG